MLLREIKDLGKWRDTPCSWVGRLDFVKMGILPILMYIFHLIPIKTSAGIFVEISQMILKLICKFKESIAVRTIWEKNKVGGQIRLECKAF